MIIILLALLLLFCPALQAQDAQLAALRATVLSLRPHADERRQTRDATPELTVAKHQLRDWVESHLTTFAETGDETAIAEELRNGLRDSQLFCEELKKCNLSALGFLDEVLVVREREFLTIQTAVGIWCGYDYSAYVYRWSGVRWQRIWENEQNTYTEKNYLPQIIYAVHISAPDEKGNRLLLTLGSRPGCSSGYQPVYYRVWRMNARYETQKPLLDGTEVANIGGYPPVQGQVLPDDVLIEFTVGGTGYGETHRAVRHFEVRDGRARQVDPIAITPRDFVEEWLSAPWTESAARSESPSLKQWHAKLHRDDMMGDFPDPAMRCTTGMGLWQIATHLKDGPKTYYLVRFKEPYYFTMAGISDRPYPDCTIADPKGDEHLPLFER